MRATLTRSAFLGIIMATSAATVTGCSSGSSTHANAPTTASSTTTDAGVTPSSSDVTISGTPQSEWPTTAPTTEAPNPTGSAATSFAHQPNKDQSALPGKYMAAFLKTSGQSQDAWAKTMLAMTSPQFGSRLAIQGLDRLPQHQKVTGSAKLVWVSPDQPEAEWFVPTSNGGYTLTEDLSDPKGKIIDMQLGNMNTSSTPTDPE